MIPVSTDDFAIGIAHQSFFLFSPDNEASLPAERFIFRLSPNVDDQIECNAGTQIIGEQEAPVGLVLMPWQADQPATLDARPTHRQESLEPLDTEAFRQRVITDEAIAAYRRAGLRRD